MSTEPPVLQKIAALQEARSVQKSVGGALGHGLSKAQLLKQSLQPVKLTPFKKAIIRFKRNRFAVWSSYGICLVLAYLLLAPVLSPHAYFSSVCDTSEGFRKAVHAEPPSWSHWFGTNKQGKDMFVQVAKAGRVSLFTSLLAAIIAATIGTLIGAWSGLLGGWQDEILMRFADLVEAIPNVFVAMLIAPHLSQAFFVFFLALSFLQWVHIARMVRAHTLAMKEGGFIEAAQICGVGRFALLTRHIFPNVAAMVGLFLPQIVQNLIMVEVFYAYFGMGVQPPFVSWGRLIKEGGAPYGENFCEAWTPVYIFVLTLLCLNLLSMGLRDALDPKDR